MENETAFKLRKLAEGLINSKLRKAFETSAEYIENDSWPEEVIESLDQLQQESIVLLLARTEFLLNRVVETEVRLRTQR